MFIFRPICLLSSVSSCSICCNACCVPEHTNMSSANRRLFRNSLSKCTHLFLEFNLLNMLSNVAVNSSSEMVSPVLHLSIMILSLYLCRCIITELNKIRRWSRVKRMVPTAPQGKALVIHPVGKRPRGRPRNRWEDDVPKWYNDIGIPMTDVNNWVEDRRPIVYPIDADGRTLRSK